MAGSQKLDRKVFEPKDGVKDNKNPIIFLHAMLCSKEIWDDIPQRVADGTGRKVYTYDARCHGEHKNMESFSFEELAQDLYSFMDENKIEKAVLVGHSMGGKAAISVALNKPERLEKVFIVDMYVQKIPNKLIERSIRFTEDWAAVVRELDANTPEDQITSTSLLKLYEKLDYGTEMITEQEAYTKSTFRYTQSDGKLDVYYNAPVLVKALKDYIEKGKESVGKYTGPAFFLYGTKSPYQVNDQDKNIKEHFPAAELIKFEGAPHHIFAHSPDMFVQVIVEKTNLPVS